MVDAVNSGYKEEAQTIDFSATRKPSAFIDDEWSDLSDELDNSSVKYLFADFEFVTGAASAFTDGSTFSLYLVPAMDGTNYPDWTSDGTADEPDNEQYFVGSFTVGAATSTRTTLRGVSMPPGKFKVGMRNQSGQTTTSGVLKYRRWGYASA